MEIELISIKSEFSLQWKIPLTSFRLIIRGVILKLTLGTAYRHPEQQTISTFQSALLTTCTFSK